MNKLVHRWLPLLLLAAGFAASWAIPHFKLLDAYVQLILMYVGINIILAVSLNVVNGYMGEFSVGHAGFMAIGAYTASLLTVKVFPSLAPQLFPLAVAAGGAAAAVLGLAVAIPSFKTRGDYLAIVTLAFLMIVKSSIENIDAIGGPRGLLGMKKLTTLPWIFFWTTAALWLIRNFIYSSFGRGVLAIREDETASALMSVNTRRIKLLAFTLSAFFTGVAGALFAHVLMFINPRAFDIIKSTDILIMVYLGGIASLGGSILGAVLYTVLLEALRPSSLEAMMMWIPGLPEATQTWALEHLITPMGRWRMAIMPLLLVLMMIYRPRGIMGQREVPWFIPWRERLATAAARRQQEKPHGPA